MPNVADIYAGVGGLSLGAARAGFRIAAAVENDKFAFAAHEKNFPSCKHSKEDATSLSGKRLLEIAGLKKGELDGLIAGPPCQGFSHIGQRDAADDRNELFFHSFRLIGETRPKFFLIENVPGILDESYDDLRERALKLVEKQYVMLAPLKVVASDYGAPTKRKRIFFIGYIAKHFSDLSEKDFAPPKGVSPVYVRNALEGLPVEIDPLWQSEESGWRKIDKLEISYYAERITGSIPEGVGDPRSVDRYLAQNEVSGCLGTRHTPDVLARYALLDYGERDEISKAIKLDPDGFCPTLRAGTDITRGKYQAVRPVHYLKPRVITPREGARLQGFPDWFVFDKTKWHSFRQIGNSVSPLVAEYLLKVLLSKLVN